MPIAQPNDETASALVPDPTIPGRASHHYLELDGLRGIAIILVLLFHAFLELKWDSPAISAVAKVPTAGWVGVDVFFVLSGFLITGILLDTKSNFAYFRNFYARRALRIFPVYYLVMATVFLVLPLFGLFTTDGLRLIQSRQLWLWSHLTNLGFVYHRKVWASSDWLDLTHLWSLAVEEQFYLFWPVIVYFLPNRGLKIACAGCIAISFLLRFSLWQLGMRNGALYFPTPCRLDGLAIGALVAILSRDTGGLVRLSGMARWAAGAAIAGLGVLILARGGLSFADKPTVVFGPLLVSLLAASAISSVTGPTPATWLVSVLRNDFLRMSGKYSYGLYLFHGLLLKPLVILMPPDGLSKLGNLGFICVFALSSYGAAFASWHLFEKHWLKLKTSFDYRPQRVS